MFKKYSTLIDTSLPMLSESAKPYQYMTERHLQAIWFEQKYFSQLLTADGNPVQVLSPGIWNAEAGPDFLKAHLRIGNQEVRGDVELHLLEESWNQHQHHLDERYNQVIFHLSLWQPKQMKPIHTKNGTAIIQAYLEPYLTIPHARIVQLIDLDLYPYKRFLGSGRCAHALFRTLSEDSIVHFFHNAAEWRLTQKRNFLHARFPEASTQLLAGMAMALGYKNNAENFIELFSWLSQVNESEPDFKLAMALKACHFFDAAYQKKWQRSTYYQKLLSLSNQIPNNPIPSVKLTLNQIRPLNHPLRRLVVLIKLLEDKNVRSLYEQMISRWEEQWPQKESEKEWKALQKGFLGCMPSYQDDYWNVHYNFEEQPRKEYVPLLGEDIKAEMLTNAFLPLLYYEVLQGGNSEELNAFRAFYKSFRAMQTGKTRYLTHRFFGDTPKGQLLNSAYCEQGAYQLHRDFCLHYEASCEGCPFVDRMTQ